MFHTNRAVALRVAAFTVVVGGITACAEKPAPGADSAKTAVAPVSAMTATCKLDGGTPACGGLLPRTFIMTPRIGELRSAVAGNTLMRSKGSFRRTDCVGPTCVRPYSYTVINRQAREFELKDLPNDKAIVIGALRFEAGLPYDDSYYKVGKGRGSTEEQRHLYFVAYKIIDGSTPTSGEGDVVAKWTLYGVEEGTNAVQAVATGNIVDCRNDHGGGGVYSAYLGCAAEKVYRKIAPDEQTFQAMLDASGLEQGSGNDSLVKVLQQKSLSAFIKDLVPAIHPSIGSYWFACAGGCCTADL